MSNHFDLFVKQWVLLLVYAFSLEASSVWIPSESPAFRKTVYKAIAQPVKTLKVSSEVNGKVLDMPVEMGREILEGQKIKIEDTRAQLEVQLNQAQVKASTKKIEGIQKDIQLQTAKKLFFEKELKRAKALFAKGSLSEGLLDQKELDAKMNQVALEQFKIKEAELKSLLSQAQANLKLSLDLLNKHSIDLPAGWVVSQKNIEAQSLVTAFQPLVELADISQFKFIFYLSAEEILYLQRRSVIELSLEQPVQKKVIAQLVGVNPLPDPQTQKLKVELRVNNASKNNVISGVMANLELSMPDQNGFLQVHEKFIIEEFEQKYLIDENGKKYSIKVIRKVGDDYVISNQNLPNIPYTVIER